MRVLFAANQGGLPVVELNGALATALAAKLPSVRCDFIVWKRAEADVARALAPIGGDIHAFENYLATAPQEWRSEVERLATDYSGVNWSAVIASERSFTDSSFLLGGAGHRIETEDYVLRLLVNIVRFFEKVLASGYDALVCQTADSFFTHVLFKVARHHGVRIFAISPAWLQEDGKPGSFFTNDEYLRCDRMKQAYEGLLKRSLSQQEIDRVERLRKSIVEFDGNKAFYAVTKRNFGRSALSPNIRKLPAYLIENLGKNKNLDYTRIDPLAKARANLLRVWRKWRMRKLVGTFDSAIPAKSVFFPLHFQPEQSTLVGGIYCANQVGLIENISKSLPLGYTLVLKEHPAGRGVRPAWQYRHLASFPNVMFSDAPSKEIAKKTLATITITGTIGVEAMALDRPVIMLGRSFFDYAGVLYKAQSVEELPAILRRILIDGDYAQRSDRQDLIRKFMLSYLMGLTPHFPRPDAAAHLVDFLIEHFVAENILRRAA
jgi:hypothetical protein